MSFLNASLLAGLALITIPVILHFLLRQKPKKLLFPALQLIQQRRKQSVRRLRLRHFWLMLLRMLGIALIVFAVARPSLPPANYSLTTLEIVGIFGLAILGIGAYFFLSHRVDQATSSAFVREERKGKFRGWSTALTLLAILLLVGIPYQQRVAAEIKDPAPARELNVPVAGIMLFDGSLSMSYLLEGKTSLERAQEIAHEHLQTLPTGSRLAVTDNTNDNPVLFQSTLMSAQNRLDNLEPSTVSLPLDDRLRDCLKAHEEDQRRTAEDLAVSSGVTGQDRYIRRIYLFTDLAKTSWREQAGKLLRDELANFKNINLYIVDVGQTDAKNLAITEVTLSRERIPSGGDLIVSATVVSHGQDVEQQSVELIFEGESGNQAKVGQTTVKLDAGIPAQIEFPVVTELTKRVIHGEVRLASRDSLAFDDVRYFSAEVSPPPKVLVVAPDKEAANEWMTALAPLESINASKNKFRPQFATPLQLRGANLTEFAAVTLINVEKLRDDEWFQLGKYVEGGGGLVVILGSELDSDSVVSYGRAQAQNFLPAELYAWKPENDWRMSLDDRTHPLFWKFRQYENYGSFAIMENDVWVSRFWSVIPAEGANVLSSYNDSDNSPALIERTHGRGRTVMFTTAVNLPENYRQRWNNLPSPLLSPWVFQAFAQQMIEYVSRFTDLQHNFQCGDQIPITLDSANEARQFLLREPKLKQSRISLEPNETQFLITGKIEPGQYDVVEIGSRPLTGFSMNVTSLESDLNRLTEQDLNERFGEDRCKLSDGIEELNDDINAADIGQEIYPALLMLAIVAFLGEHMMANRFYTASPAEIENSI